MRAVSSADVPRVEGAGEAVRTARSPYRGRVHVLSGSEWRARAEAHAARVDAFVEPHLARRAERVKHPVHDFLFTYYSQRPAQLRRWHPGYGVALADVTADEVPEIIVLRRETAEVAIYGRLGDAHYTVIGVYQVPLNPVSLEVAQLDDDGVPDIVVAAAGADAVSVLMSFP